MFHSPLLRCICCSFTVSFSTIALPNVTIPVGSRGHYPSAFPLDFSLGTRCVYVSVCMYACATMSYIQPRERRITGRFNSNICHFDKNMCFCVPSLLLIANSNPLVHDEHNERTRTRERNPGVGEDGGWEHWLGGWELGRKREAPVATFSPFTLKMCRKLCVFVSSVWGGPFHTLLFPLLCQWMVVLERTNSGFGGAL